jgi:hypothetical protein
LSFETPRVPIGSETVVVRTEGMTMSELDGETIMMNLKSTHYFGLEGMAGWIWRLRAELRSVSGLCDLLIRA